MRGRRKTPSALNTLRGNPGKRAPNRNEPKPLPVIPDRPKNLSDEAITAWCALAPRLHRLGLLTEIDGFALEQLCENYAEILALRDEVVDGGRQQEVRTQAGSAMVRAMPAVAQLADAERRFASMMDRFGLNPSSRSKVTTAGEGPAQNAFARLVG